MKNVGDIKILTTDGWSDFKGIIKNPKNNIYGHSLLNIVVMILKLLKHKTIKYIIHIKNVSHFVNLKFVMIFL